jgi:signal transduction histidine kinase
VFRTLASLLLALLLVFAAAAAQPPPSAVELREALLLENGRERPVMLPDSWEASAPQRRGTVRYRLLLPDVALRWPPSALFVPRAGNAYGLALNGQTLLSAGDVRRGEGEPSRSPLLLPLPAGALHESGNVLDIELSGEPWREPGLSTVWVGPMDELQPLYARLHDHQVRGAWLVAASATVMGALALLLAWRARRFVYACFGAASLLWAWRMSGMQVDGGPWTPLGTVLLHASYAWFAVLMALYALAAVGRDTPGVRAALSAWAVVALGLAGGMVAFEAPLARTLLLIGTLLVAVWLLAVLLVTAWRQRSSAALLLALATLVSGAVGARDFWVFRVLHAYGALTWSRYTILLLLAVLAWLLVDEFARSSAALLALNRDLLDRVASKEAELQRAFEATRERERAQAVLSERDRILREMHDGLGGRLVAALALTAQVTRQAGVPAVPADAPGGTAAPPLDGAALEEPLRELKMTLDDCLVELRLALDSLETERRPLVEALGELRFRVEPTLRAAGVRLVWQVADAASEAELPASETLHVLRIVREALTNVIKHARASVAWLRLEARADGGLVLAVVDNGLRQRASEEQSPLPLFVPKTVVHGGRGLANMERRARSLGGTLESGPHPEGWAVTLTLPAGAAGMPAPVARAVQPPAAEREGVPLAGSPPDAREERVPPAAGRPAEAS